MPTKTFCNSKEKAD